MVFIHNTQYFRFDFCLGLRLICNNSLSIVYQLFVQLIANNENQFNRSIEMKNDEWRTMNDVIVHKTLGDIYCKMKWNCFMMLTAFHTIWLADWLSISIPLIVSPLIIADFYCECVVVIVKVVAFFIRALFMNNEPQSQLQLQLPP